MSKQFEYTTLAQRYTARYPRLTYVGIQASFWIVANLLLVAIVNLQSQVIGQLFQIPVENKFGSMLLIAIVLGILYGISLGSVGYYLDRTFFRKQPLGKIILFKTLGSLALLILLLWLLRFSLFDVLIAPSLHRRGIHLHTGFWSNVFYLLLVYYFL